MTPADKHIEEGESEQLFRMWTVMWILLAILVQAVF